MDEEVVLLEEQLAAAEASIEQLQARLADAEATAESGRQEVRELRRQLEQAREAASRQEALAESRGREIQSLQAAVEQAVERGRAAALRYREAVLAGEPHLPAELVGGETVEEIEESLARARQTVAQVRQHLEQQAQALRVPPGATTRSVPDLEGLSPAEKIRLGLGA